MTDVIRPAPSDLERYEDAVVAHLREHLPVDVWVDVLPDDYETVDASGMDRAVFVQFAGSQPDRGRLAVALQGPVSFALICLARSRRGGRDGGFGAIGLMEAAEQAVAGKAIQGGTELTVTSSSLEGQSGGLWRHVVVVSTTLTRGRPTHATAPMFPHRFDRAAG